MQVFSGSRSNKEKGAIKQRVHLKSAQQIEQMRPASRIVAEALVKARQAVRPGITTHEIDQIVEIHFKERGAIPVFKGFAGNKAPPYPAVTCISVNEEVVHGIPGSRVLREGDLVSIDTGCNFNGWCGDSAISVAVGTLPADRQRLLDVAEETLRLAIFEMSHQRKWSQVARKIQDYVHSQGYSVVEKFVGHGIGRSMHEDPQVPNYDARTWREHDFWLDEGLVIAVEPMLNMGVKETRVRADHWTVETADGMCSAHVEHTVAITRNGVEILTARDDFE